MNRPVTLTSILRTFFLFSFVSIGATEYWNWQNIETQKIKFPKSFEWGTTAHAYEIEGNCTNNTWYAWEQHINNDGKPFAYERSGIACDQWNRYKQDIQLMAGMGLNTYCFSVEWSKIEPENGIFNEEALQHYADLCDELNKNDITPIIILKDRRDPLWFGYLGSFEKESNIAIFERYCLKVFETLKNKTSRFITFWTPEVHAIQGYMRGSNPPGIQNTKTAVTVLKNELEAHVRVYKAIKSAPGGNKSQIGIIKHVHQLEPWYPWDRLGCYVAKVLMDDSFYNFFTTGIFEVKLPGMAWQKHTNTFAPKSVDFIGLNYSSHGYIKNFQRVSARNEIQTDCKEFTIYPEGLYLAIKEVSNKLANKLNIPIIITQNGVATKDESIRDLFFKRYLYALSKAIEDGYNVRGYHYYTLYDCYTWGGYDKGFGLFSVDRTTLERTEKTGTKYYRHVINSSK